VAGYDKSIHVLPRTDGKGVAATCVSCHGPAHEILASGDRRSQTHVLNIVATCARCHGDAKVVESVDLPRTVVNDFQDSIHGRALTESGLVVAPTCATCHGAHEVRRAKDPASKVSKLHLAETCGNCHVSIKEQYDKSIHAKKAAEGDKKAPNCETCHSAHRIQRIAGASWELDVIRECGTCHKESLTTYRDTFHGRVTELGYTRMAKCADCHHAHDIVAKTDSGSPVLNVNLTATCQRCHKNATEGFTLYDPHANPEIPKRSVLLYYTAKLMKGLLFGVFGFFWLHTGLWLWRGFRDRKANARKA